MSALFPQRGAVFRSMARTLGGARVGAEAPSQEGRAQDPHKAWGPFHARPGGPSRALEISPGPTGMFHGGQRYPCRRSLHQTAAWSAMDLAAMPPWRARQVGGLFGSRDQRDDRDHWPMVTAKVTTCGDRREMERGGRGSECLRSSLATVRPRGIATMPRARDGTGAAILRLISV